MIQRFWWETGIRHRGSRPTAPGRSLLFATTQVLVPIPLRTLSLFPLAFGSVKRGGDFKTRLIYGAKGSSGGSTPNNPSVCGGYTCEYVVV